MEFSEFVQHCLSSKCLRRTMITPGCNATHKHKSCYRKWLKKNKEKEIKNNIFVVNVQWEVCKQKVHQRDKTCRIEFLLTVEELQHIIEHYQNGYTFLNRILDVAHLIPRSQKPKLMYDLDNLVLISRYFHTLIDQFKHPVYQHKISSEERLNWLKSALDRKRNVV